MSNVDLGMALVWDGPTIPTGEYLEVNMFNGTAFLNGDEANQLRGFDPTLSEWFFLATGDNQIDTNARTTWLVNNAWA